MDTKNQASLQELEQEYARHDEEMRKDPRVCYNPRIVNIRKSQRSEINITCSLSDIPVGH